MITVIREAEGRLADTANGIAGEAEGWRAICFYFDQLTEQYRSDYQIHIAVNLLGDLLAAHSGGVFLCADSTIVLLCRNVTKGQLDRAMFQLRYLFMDDPLAYNANGDENPAFCRVFDLGVEYAEFYQFCRKKLAQSKHLEQQVERAAKPIANYEGVGAPPAKIFTPTRLAHVEHDLNKADLSRVLRRQPVCAVTASYDVRKLFDEYYIHIAHLKKMLRTDADFFSNRWLFRYLTQLLDDRMLALISINPLRYLESPVSLNLNVETILSKRFAEFDASIRHLIKSSLVVEINFGDAFYDIAGFMEAKSLLQKQGYKVCLDGLTTQSIMQINRDRLGFELLKLQWNGTIKYDPESEDGIALMRAIKNCGQHRVILCHCDTQQAVAYGLMMGINLFQGRFLDRVLNPSQTIEN